MSDMKTVELDKPLLSCRFCDLEVVQKSAHVLFRGLAAACVDNTKGDFFRSPASMAFDMRNEMLDYLRRKCESYAAEPITSCGLGTENAVHPMKIISCFSDEFANSKRNLLSRVSGWLPSEGRENYIDIILQEIEANGFWPIVDREAIAEILLRYVDVRKEFHCPMSFSSPAGLGEHKALCRFRPVKCLNEGCKCCFSAVHLKAHDQECLFKILPCQQKCSQTIARHKMHEHCNTACPMKVVNCPFYHAGCQSSFPQYKIEQHYSEFLHSHLLCILQVLYRHEESMEDLKKRVQLLEKSQSLYERSEALDMRSLTISIKEQEAKMKKLESNLSKISRSSSS